MAVRSLKLKMVLGRREGREGHRENLWLTHAVLNVAVAEVERVLLLCRGRGYCNADDELVPEESVRWLQSEEAQRLQHASGSPPAWVRRLRAGQPWQDAFIKDQEKKRKEVKGVPLLIRRCRMRCSCVRRGKRDRK